jgi:asparagine synthase (glutamine-hydrolysing)
VCGFVGYVNSNGTKTSLDVLRSMTSAINHRGPDGEGFYNHENVGLGHKRLAIIDVSAAGLQPMETIAQDLVVAYNGEIYNYKEIRSELVALGLNFKTGTDTEVLLNAWMTWGKDCILKFNGMFAFAIFDSKLEKLFLVRDRFGIKPLYFGIWNNTFIFGSEQKSILRHPSFSKELEISSFIEYFTFQNILSHDTLMKGMKVLGAGEILTLSTTSDNEYMIDKYWSFDFQNNTDHKLSKNDATSELSRILEEAIERQLISDVRVGSYLSGGMDSGTITTIASRSVDNLDTFNIGFSAFNDAEDPSGNDERIEAREIARINGTNHHEKLIGPQELELCLDNLVHAVEEPRVGQSYPNFYAAQLASSKVKVVLSGAGGDELFAGYPWRYGPALTSSSSNIFLNEYFRLWNRIIPIDNFETAFSPISHFLTSYDPRAVFNGFFDLDAKPNSNDLLSQSLQFEAQTFLHGLLLVEDKISMHHSLETRVPFLDNNLVDFALTIPNKLKIDFSSSVSTGAKKNYGKIVLRDAMTRFLPDKITRAPKRGFSGPDASWFRNENRGYLEREILGQNPLFNLISREYVVNEMNNHFNGIARNRLQIWSFLVMTKYLKKFH